MPAAVELEHVTKRFGEVMAVDDVSFTVDKNEFFSLLGPSGCGKTTTLRCVAGLEEPDSGIIKLSGKVVTNVPAHKRNVGLVFQDLALFPHMNVFDNIAFGLEMKKVSEEEIEKRVKNALELVGLKGLETRRIHQLSGGQKQRVALCRSLVPEPDVLLLDEPLGALDLKIRRRMTVELRRIQKEVEKTFIYVTHDQTEAIVMSDRIAVMQGGKIKQIGESREIYSHPKDPFIASFIGEAVNTIKGVCEKPGVFVGKKLEKPVKVEIREELLNIPAVLSIRPERIRMAKKLRNLDNILNTRISSTLFKGMYHEYEVETGSDLMIKVFVPYMGPKTTFQVHDSVQIGWNKEDAVIIPI
ncbi:MAG: ABC transporter ATP-binding protein [Candidatus Bathyarchaeota archaeon]|nr:ABC transporter ATP-binding protein [Candidatus Bathyarchaeota archaeon]